MDMISFELGDKMRDIDTRVNWKLNEFKQKIDDKISEEFVLSFLEKTQKKVEQSMREYQLKSDIDPVRIDEIEKSMQENRLKAENGITECKHKLEGIRSEIDLDLVREDLFKEYRVKNEKRQEYFNTNFVEAFDRTDLPAIVKDLRKPLLILHSPIDTIVGINNAEKLYVSAHHPKSFVTLDNADHLLSKEKDSLYVGEVIGTWVKRYFPQVKNTMLDILYGKVYGYNR